MEVTLILLGRPWNFDKHTFHDGHSSKSSFTFTSLKIALVHLTPQEVNQGDNVVIDAIKLTLLNYSNFSIAKLVVIKLDIVKLVLSHLSTNTEFIFNIWFLKIYPNAIKTSYYEKIGFWYAKNKRQENTRL